MRIACLITMKYQGIKIIEIFGFDVGIKKRRNGNAM